MSCKNRPRPKIYVEKEKAKERRIKFLEDKYPILSWRAQKLGAIQPERTFVLQEAALFLEMLEGFLLDADGMRIYFATYTSGGPHIPQYCNHLMTVVYVPTKKEIDDESRYFIIEKGLSRPVNIGKQVAKNWVEYFYKEKLEHLDSTVPHPEGDTQSLYYDLEKLTDLADEVRCQLTNIDIKIAGVKTNFSTFLSNEGTGNKLAKKLNIDFVFTNADGNDVPIETTDGWPDRKDPKDDDNKDNITDQKYLDTGNPCPPNTCGGSSLPRP